MQPYPGYDVKEGSTINLYTNQNETYNKDVIMPDVRGYSKKAAIELLEELGINYTIQGDKSKYSKWRTYIKRHNC